MCFLINLSNFNILIILAIGKAFSVLSDAQKRKQYDNYGPESFEASGETSTRSTHTHRSHYGTHYSWNDEEFSADELFNLFFGGTTAHSSHNRRRQAQHSSTQHNFTFTQSPVKC
jgi:DnaJ-class molecular chaperone